MPVSRRDFATSIFGATLCVLTGRAHAQERTGADEVLSRLAGAGLQARLGGVPSDQHTARLDHELRAIGAGGDAAYFILLHDLVHWASVRGIAIGPGRGAAPSSVVLWALGVTQLDPLAHGLIFERFYRPGRPDVDLDACAHRRDELVAFFEERFGHERVGFVTDREFGGRTGVVLVGEARLPRGTCTLDELSDLRRDAVNNGRLAQDLLGLPILTVLSRVPPCSDYSRGFEVLRSGNLEQVFLGSPAFAHLLVRAQPRSLEEVVAVYTLDRPGTLHVGLFDEYVARGHGKQPRGLHPIVDQILLQTRGLFVYQEQVIQVLHELGGMDHARADAARRSLGRRSRTEIATVADEFLAGASARVSRETAEELMNSLVQWSGYTFNRSHAIGYAQLMLASAAAKATFPREYRAAWEAVD